MKHTGIFYAQDSEGNVYEIDEYTAYREFKYGHNLREEPQERFLFLNSNAASYNKEDDTFTIAGEDLILINVS